MLYILFLSGMTSKSWKKITVLGETWIDCEFPSLVGSTAVCPEVVQYPSVLVLPSSLVAGYQINLLSQLRKVGLRRDLIQNPSCWVRALQNWHLSLGLCHQAPFLEDTHGKMCAVLNLHPANVDNAVIVCSRLSPCFTKRKKGSCTGAGQLAGFLVLRRLAQL